MVPWHPLHPPRYGPGVTLIFEKQKTLINAERRIHITPSKLEDKFMLQFGIAYEQAITEHIEFAYSNFK